MDGPAVDPATLRAEASVLVVIDVQERLVPALDGGARMVDAVRRLVGAARILGVPVVHTEQYPKGLGRTLPDLAADSSSVLEKTAFDACGAGLADRLPEDRTVVLAGCEAHVCVLQTGAGLMVAGRRVAVVADAVASRLETNRAAALARLSRRGAEIVTAEMVMFEWLGTADHPSFREVLALVR